MPAIKKIKNFTNFIKKLITEIKKDDIFSAANDLTYKIFFSLFPFTIFLMSAVSFFKLDAEILINEISSVLPYVINQSVKDIIKEILNMRNANILSVSLLISLYSASSGFRTAMRSINKAYGRKDSRKFYLKILISMALVVIFTVIIIASFVLLIFGGEILNFIKNYYNFHNALMFYIFNVSRYIISVIIMFFSVVLINKLALANLGRLGKLDRLEQKTKIKSLFPGAFITVFAWLAVSGVFNIYIEKFSSYSSVYGSIAGIIIFMLWLNIMCAALLIGSEINAISVINMQKT